MSSLLVLALPLLLGACGVTDGAAYKIEGDREHAINVMRERNFLWSNWDVSVVVARQPECMRRHHLKSVNKDAAVKVELYRSLEGGFILRQGKRWYVAETKQCQLQQFPEAPAEPGDLVGAFVEKDGIFQFKPTESNGDKAGKSASNGN